MPRAKFYVDGFNLYHAIDDLGAPRLKWFSLMSFAQFIARKNGESLVGIDYFSALATFKPQSVGRQQTYLRALKATGVTYHLGQFKSKNRRCLACGTRWIAHEEKETDVNIAIKLLEDAMDGLTDVMYVVSADSDLAPALKSIRGRFSQIECVTVAPPNRRHPAELLHLSHRAAAITPDALKRNRLPDSIQDSAGTISSPIEYQ